MYTTIGYRLRAVGQNPSTSRVAGSSIYHKDIVLTMLVSGGPVGLAGTMDLIGIRSYWLFQPAGMNMLGSGFIGVAVAFRPD